ncbi:hypothetical protein ACE2AJ_20660 [Aquihabitans daechungensis]|uniref:hypothetical protein n=1 Tax=Aquihabitans daechungensis TaxID=1052257 RepID=UPI003B9F04F3
MRQRLSGLIVVLTLASLGACSSDGEAPATQPAPQVSTFGQGDFDDIPLHPRSEAIGRRSEKDGVVTQSFGVRGATPSQILAFYERGLEPPSWTQIGGVERVGTTTVRGEWRKDGRTLRISASEAPNVPDGQPSSTAVTSQYSLVLGAGV